jgi:hypothetical protein
MKHPDFLHFNQLKEIRVIRKIRVKSVPFNPLFVLFI